MTTTNLVLPELSLDDALSCLKPYQRNLMTQLISIHGEEEAAKIWLSSNGPSGLEKFGSSTPNPKPFWDNFYSEFRAFLCGDAKYEEERKKIAELAKQHITTQIYAISAVIAVAIGVAVALVIPVISILCYLAAKIGVNAWCATAQK